MKLVWHIIAKDLRRHQLPYGLFLCLLLAKQAVIVLGFADWSADAEWFERLQMGDMVLSVVEGAVAFLLVGSWVLEDPLVGSTQFWITRPVSGRRLLGAKALGVVLLFIAVPLVVTATGWLACGLRAVELLRQTGLWLGVQMSVAAVAFVFGTLSDRGNRFLVVMLGLAVAFVTLAPVMSKLFTVYPETRALAATRTMVGLTLIVAAAGGAIWLQFTRRRLALGAAWLLVGVVLGVAAWNQFPFEIDRGWRRTPRELEEARGVELSILRVQPALPSSSKTPAGQSWIEVVYGVRNLPRELILSSASYGRFVFVAPDGTRHETERSLVAVDGGRERDVRSALGIGPNVTLDDPETKAKIARQVAEIQQRRRDAIQKQLTEGKLTVAKAAEMIRGLDLARAAMLEGEPTLTARMLVPVGLVAKLADGAVTLESLVDVRFERLRSRGELSLDDARSAIGDGYRARILPSGEEPDQKQQARRATVLAAHGAAGKRLLFCVVNRSSGYVGPFHVERSSAFPVTFRMSRTNLNYTLPRVWRSGEWQRAPGVEDGLAVAVLTSDDVGLVRRAVQRANVPWGVTKP